MKQTKHQIAREREKKTRDNVQVHPCCSHLKNYTCMIILFHQEEYEQSNGHWNKRNNTKYANFFFRFSTHF